jgi:hypothetical protein
MGEVNRFGAFPGRSGNLRKRNRRHISMVPPGPESCQPSAARSATVSEDYTIWAGAARGVFTVRASSTRREYKPA